MSNEINEVETMNQSQRGRNLESSTLLWLTSHPDPSVVSRLRNIIDYVKSIENVDACDQYIKRSIDNEQIYVLSEIPYNSDKAHIYIYESDNNDNSMNKAIENLETDFHAEIDPLGMNILKQSTHSPLNSDFLWFQRVLNVLIETEDRDMARMHFIDIYKRYFHGNTKKEAKIQEFEQNYQAENAIQWYSRESFFYDVLNKGLRTQDIDVLYSFRFFLQDIFRQLKSLYEKTSHGIELIAYRGQTISAKELQTIRENIGQFISLNSFISTSRECHIATGFVNSGKSSEERIQFHIKVDKNLTNPKPFADISNFSHFVQEREVLFMAGSIFEITNVLFSEMSSVWIIELNLCNENIYELHDVYELERNIVSDKKSPFSLAAVLLRMNMFDRAEKYYKNLLEQGSINDISSTELTTNCYWGLSKVARKRGDFDVALAYSRLAVEESQKHSELLILSYKYISFNYLDIHLTSDAMEYQLKALEIQREINDKDYQIADTLFNIGIIHFSLLKPQLQSALEYYTQALNIYKELNMEEEIIRCYHAIGNVHNRKKDTKLALTYHLRALELIENKYTAYLPYRIDALENIARAYEALHDHDQAIKYYNDALNVKLKYEPFNDPEIAQSYENIGGIYHRRRDFAKAVEMYNKAIEIRQVYQPMDHPDIESLVSQRDILLGYIDNPPPEFVNFDYSSDEEVQFESMKDALDYMSNQMDSDESDQ